MISFRPVPLPRENIRGSESGRLPVPEPLCWLSTCISGFLAVTVVAYVNMLLTTMVCTRVADPMAMRNTRLMANVSLARNDLGRSLPASACIRPDAFAVFVAFIAAGILPRVSRRWPRDR